jgi:hypothetical protein
MKSKLPVCAFISSRSRENDDLMRAERLCVLDLAWAGGKGDDMGTERAGELDAHVAEAAYADDPDLLPGPIFQWRSGDQVVMPCAEQGRHRRQILRILANAEDEFLADDDPVRIAAEGVAARALLRPVIGAGEAVLAILLQPLLAGAAGKAGVDHAAHADNVAGFELRDCAADLGHFPNNLMAWHARIAGAAPLAPRRMEIGMADAAKADCNNDVFRARIAPLEAEGLEFGIGRVNCVAAGI